MVFGLTEIFEQSQKNLFDFGAKADESANVVLDRLSETPGESGLGHVSGSAQTTKAKEGQVQVFRLIRGVSRAWFWPDQQCILKWPRSVWPWQCS